MGKEEIFKKFVAFENDLRSQLSDKEAVKTLIHTLEGSIGQEQAFLMSRVSWILKQHFPDIQINLKTKEGPDFRASGLSGGVAYGEWSRNLAVQALGRALLGIGPFGLAIVFCTGTMPETKELQARNWNDHCVYVIIL